MLVEVLPFFGLNVSKCTTTAFGSGLINHTWLISCPPEQFILQRINTNVFKSPEVIESNIDAIGNYLALYTPHYRFVRPVTTVDGKGVLQHPVQGWFRLFPFVQDSHTVDVVNSPSEAFEAAKQFGLFTACLKGFDASFLKPTLPDFHNLSLRWERFSIAVAASSAERKKQAAEIIQFLQNHYSIVEEYEKLVANSALKKRVTHHDTKISNVLFDNAGKGLCVIDLDTVMPGYFISDVGDMLRTYLSPVSEEEQDFSKIEIRDDYFTAIAEGYLSQLGKELTDEETAHFVYAGKFMIYMQALRFLTDHLNNDIYYGAKYEGHNLVRAGNQIILLKRLTEKEFELQKIVTGLNQKEMAVSYS